MLLPHFGGAFHVWTTSLMFFQGALFLAYAYAHLLAGRVGKWHLLLVAAPLLLLPPGVGDGSAQSAESVAILARLAAWIALPFGVLATTAGVAPHWVASAGRAPYGLYAVSNAGSLGALLTYALVIEPLVGVEAQRWAWTIGYMIYVGLAWLAWRSRGPLEAPASARPDHEKPRSTPAPGEPAPSARTYLYWGALSAAPSALLMAVTNLMALEAGNVPLVWIIPLALYLMSFVVAFAEPLDGEPSRVPRLVRRLWPHVAAVGVFFYSGGDAGGGWLTAVVHLTVLSFVALAAHGELYRARPTATHLTGYYLVIALGGWIGGAFVALLAPALFVGLFEYPIALAALALTMVAGRRQELKRWLRETPKLALLVSAALVVVIVVKVGAGASEVDHVSTLEVRRSYYGLYQVTRTPRRGGAVRDLVSGNTRHGRQREGDRTPLSYYHPSGPLGDVLQVARPVRIGVVGLGVGAAAGHLRGAQVMRFFEIDPVVAELARAHFSYLSGAGDRAEIVIGDARVSLERERASGAARYDLLLIDAFAGDAIPTHLLTVEALSLFMERVTDDGVLLLHVSNRYYDLRPVLRADAAQLGFAGVHVARIHDLELDQDPSQYVALARTEAPLEPLRLRRGWRRLIDTPSLAGSDAWTDDHIDTLAALIW